MSDVNNSILKNATVVEPLKYLSNFWRSLELSLINYNVELKLKWIKIVAAAAGDDNSDSNNIIFTVNFISKRQ